jgi:adenine-specific DNA-methyltransferase
MNFIEMESAEKLRGGFYTDPLIALFLSKWIMFAKPKSILEPSCGDGIFFEMIGKLKSRSLKNITACEIEPIEAEKARMRTRLPVSVMNIDFLKWFLFNAQNEVQFDAVIGNPPFIRYQYLPNDQQLLAEKIFSQLGLPFTRHTNAWVPFVLASIRLLKPGGRLAMVIPSEIFHIPHAGSLRRYLSEQCSRILFIDPIEIFFKETLQGTVLLLAEKKNDPVEKSRGVGIISISNQKDLSENPEYQFQSAVYANNVLNDNKWMSAFLTQKERNLLAQVRDYAKVSVFFDIASVDVGIVTGANEFFLVPDKTVKKFDLRKWAHSMFGRSDHVKGLIYSAEDHKKNKLSGLPSNFLWFQDDRIEDLPQNVRNYLETGINMNLDKRYKCRTRRPWYKVPSVYLTPVAMLKRAHHYPRLVLNNAAAYTTDTAYRIKPIDISPSALVFGFVNSLTCLTAELEGRHYGGGVLELVPSEIERLLVPKIHVSKTDLNSADNRFRKTKDGIAFLYEQNRFVLDAIGLTRNDQNVLHNAWKRLHDRRHRTAFIEIT